MAWLAVDKDGEEYIYSDSPNRYENGEWGCSTPEDEVIHLPKGTILKIIGRNLTWESRSVEI